MPYLDSDPGVELHYYDDDFTDPWQSAPTVLLQHGFSRNGKFWYNWVPLLSGEFRVLRPDMRGMGGSIIDEDQFEPSLEVFVNDVLRILDHLGIEDVAIRRRVLRRHPRTELRPPAPRTSPGAGAVQHPLPPAAPGAVRPGPGH